MENCVLNTIERFSLISKGQTVTVALSGGADSMSLLYLLLSLKNRLGITVEAAHLNHMIRGAEADRDENFVKAECEKLGVKLYCESADIPSIAAKNKISIELAARNVRYDFLKRVSRGCVATAHNADDNLETMIFNLSRGTSVDGLCGIPPKRDVFIRPLLFCTRAQIEQYCKDNNISYITDSTNLNDEYTRNKIRHKIVPVLKEINPSVEKAALRTALSLTEISEMLEIKAKSFFEESITDSGLNLKNFEDLKPAVAKRVLVKLAENTDCDITLENTHIEQMYSVALFGGKTSLPKDMQSVNKNGFLKIMQANKNGKALYEYKVKISKINNQFSENTKNVNNLFLKNSFDCDKIIGKLVCRTRQSGDSIRLKNRGCTKTLNKLYNEYGIPVYERDNIPVIADDKGIVWVYGIGVAHRCAVSEKTKEIYSVEVKKG